MTLPVLKFAPMDGSPASVPSPFGAASLVKVGGTAADALAGNAAIARTATNAQILLMAMIPLSDGRPALREADPQCPARRDSETSSVLLLALAVALAGAGGAAVHGGLGEV